MFAFLVILNRNQPLCRAVIRNQVDVTSEHRRCSRRRLASRSHSSQLAKNARNKN
jgi:hypothetical protein